MFSRIALPLLVASLCLAPSFARAETVNDPADRRLAMTLDAATRNSSLIIHARVERVGGRTLYRILDTLHGVVEPAMFQGQAPTGYLELFRADREGRQLILFFFRAKAIRTYEWQLPIENGKVLHGDKLTPLADFKQDLRAARPTNAIPLEELVPQCALIVHCRTEEVDGRVYYRLLEVLKGSFQQATFARPAPEGYFNLGANRAGVEMLLFFKAQEKLNRFDAHLPVRGGKVLYRGQQLGLELFLNRVRKLAGPAEGRSAGR